VASKDSILAKMAVIIDAQTATFDRKLAASSKNFDSFGKTVTKIATGLAAGFGLTNVMDKVIGAIQNGFSVMSEFEATMSEVRAITGATGDEFQKLERDALKLGATTKFTASQVGQLQVAYGRLGFTTKEILAATKATLDLAAATGEDLAKSADVAGSTVRGFGLDAKETQRVVDVMASSFNKTALGLDNFTESMKYVAPVAAAAGATVEETTALLGTLADAGIRGSMAGTSLRKIFTDMAKDGRPLQVRLAELAAKGITMADAFDEVGRTAQTSLLILANNTEKTNQLAEAFKNVEGEAAKMARTMSDNLTGDVTKLTSAWEGLILKVGNSSPWRAAVQSITGMINTLSGVGDPSEEFRKLILAIQAGRSSGIEYFTKKLGELRREAGEPFDVNIVQELAEKYKLTDEQANKLYQSILEVNKALSFQEQVIKNVKDFAQQNGYEDLSAAVDAYKQKIYEALLAEQIRLDQLRKYTPELKKDIEQSKKQTEQYRRIIDILAEYGKGLDSISKKQEDANKKAKVYGNTLDGLQERQKDLNEAFEATDINDSGRLRTLAREMNAVDQLIDKINMIKKLEAVESVTFSSKSLKRDGSDFLKDMGIDIDSIQKKIDTAVKNIKKLSVPSSVSESWIELGPMISNSITSIADALGSGVKSVEDFGKLVLEQMASFAQQFGAALIAAGVGKISFDKFSGPGMIAAGAALVAFGSAVKSAISNRPNLGSRSSSATTNATRIQYASRGEQLRINVTGELVGRGREIRAIITNEDKRGRRTKG
jgi:hypothetical protein